MIDGYSHPDADAEVFSADGQWTEPRSPEVPEPTLQELEGSNGVLEPTYWPAVTALAIVVLLFGFLTSWVISAVGLIMFIFSMSHWIGELNRDA